MEGNDASTLIHFNYDCLCCLILEIVCVRACVCAHCIKLTMYIYCISRKDDLELNLTFRDFLESQFANPHFTTIYRRAQNFDGGKY